MGNIRTKSGALKIVVIAAILLTAPITAAALIQSQNQSSNQFISQALLLGMYFSLQPQNFPYKVELAFPYLVFDHPVGIYHAGDESNRLFVLEQPGVIKVFNNSVNTTTAGVFLDIRDRVLYFGEQGLLGLAFHPNFTTNDYFYVDYVADNPRRTVIARYTINQTNPDQANKSSEQIILEVLQPFENHKGGQLAFGPDDGYLYIALGDGGWGGDPLGNAQNLSTLLGKILRIDVNTASPPLNYSIPPTNPFNNTQGYREEIYAYGLRNPWRFSFDNVTDWLWVADVGQNAWEEIDIILSGKNYGWNIMEGNHCYSPPSGCNRTGLELPIWEYSHFVGHSITGGFVYRGSALPELSGSYIYGDFEYGQIWALNYDGVNPTNNTLLVDTNLLITSFGVDENNELYIVDYNGGIYLLNYSNSTQSQTFNIDS
nr:PQQ-dependent sugar dehydrogenase [Candidatus Freyarchaeota archaeon]